jgi:ABC-type amino acid transport substrate-binding protein
MGGLNYEITEALGRALNLKIEWSGEYLIGAQVEALKTGKMDVLCVDGPWTRSAMPYLAYTSATYYLPAYVWVVEGSPLLGQTTQSLNREDITFSAFDGDWSQDAVTNLFPKAKLLSMPASADPVQLVENVVAGKADAFITDPIFIADYNEGRAKKLVQLEPAHNLGVFPVIMTTLPEEERLNAMLTRGINFLRDTGQLQQILNKYDPSGTMLWMPAPAYVEKVK